MAKYNPLKTLKQRQAMAQTIAEAWDDEVFTEANYWSKGDKVRVYLKDRRSKYMKAMGYLQFQEGMVYYYDAPNRGTAKRTADALSKFLGDDQYMKERGRDDKHWGIIKKPGKKSPAKKKAPTKSQTDLFAQNPKEKPAAAIRVVLQVPGDNKAVSKWRIIHQVPGHKAKRLTNIPVDGDDELFAAIKVPANAMVTASIIDKTGKEHVKKKARASTLPKPAIDSWVKQAIENGRSLQPRPIDLGIALHGETWQIFQFTAKGRQSKGKGTGEANLKARLKTLFAQRYKTTRQFFASKASVSREVIADRGFGRVQEAQKTKKAKTTKAKAIKEAIAKTPMGELRARPYYKIGHECHVSEDETIEFRCTKAEKTALKRLREKANKSRPKGMTPISMSEVARHLLRQKLGLGHLATKCEAARIKL